MQQLLSPARLSLLLMIAGFFWVAITTLAVVNDRGFLAMWRMQSDVAQLAHEVQMIEQENRDLLQDARSLRFDMAYIERIAREELGLVRPGELVFELVE